MSQILRKNFFGKVVFPFLVGNFWPPFCYCNSVFQIFCFALVLLDHFISGVNLSAKCFSELGSIGTPPWLTSTLTTSYIIMGAIKYISYLYAVSVKVFAQYYTVHRNIEILSFLLESKISELISPYYKINLTIIVFNWWGRSSNSKFVH